MYRDDKLIVAHAKREFGVMCPELLLPTNVFLRHTQQILAAFVADTSNSDAERDRVREFMRTNGLDT
jgi:hypothetical protein